MSDFNFRIPIAETLVDFGKTLIDRLIPDKEEARRAEFELIKMATERDTQSLIAQLQVNLAEAQSPRLWVSGWRPYFGWVGGTGFAYMVLIKPLLVWLARIKGWPEPPDVDESLLWPLVSGILGLGSFRSWEKGKGLASK